MSVPSQEEPCLPVFSILTSRWSQLDIAMNALREQWPASILSSPPFPFNETRYYDEEMGGGLLRWWGYRNLLANPSRLSKWKKQADKIEQTLTDSAGNRTVNIDPGYLNYGMFVLATYKYDLQKIAVGEGVYADPLLIFVEGDFQPFEWSFPDFKEPDYYPVLKEFRQRYKTLRNQ